ncbi:OmpH family outer membrane protein [Aquirufa lenticrescens]|uniref:OmpH family outer membrane protein n=1 Tax=Aquirufa lenticrescens TaxID=2696560 RepID=UPI001CAA7F5C|nr:OmpH family outer membrane protein [Aquirufa lenticrescens]UAJ13647.1 OmpH family outer membrane protein [Aquirufa lenticrescens]
MRFWMAFLGILLFASTSFAQKFGYVDTEFITSKMPEYAKAQQQIDQNTRTWLAEVEKKKEEVEKLEKEYKLEELLLTEDLKQQRLSAIQAKSKEAKAFENQVFGAEGELFKLKQAAYKSILDQISKAIEKVVRAKRLDFIFDKANDGLVLLYTNPVHDYSDYVLEELGLELDPNLVEKTKKEEAQEPKSPKKN